MLLAPRWPCCAIWKRDKKDKKRGKRTEGFVSVKRHVFGSNAERVVWDKLRRRWGDRYSLYPNLPFLMVFDTNNLVDVSAWPDARPAPKVSAQEFGRLKKTSIDFTLCDGADTPLVCIEFDGMQEGFNVGTKYRAPEPTDPWRDTEMSLKLKVAHGSLFPFFVVGSREFKDYSQALQICLVDAIIGSVLAGQALQKRASDFNPQELGMTSEEFERLSASDQYELIQDWFIGAEVEADVTHNPVFAAAHDLWQDLSSRLGPMRRTTRYVCVPSLEGAQTPIERANLMRKAILEGAECTITTQQFGEVKRTVWLPNFNVPSFSAHGFLDELAELVTLDAVHRLLSTLTGKPVARRAFPRPNHLSFP